MKSLSRSCLLVLLFGLCAQNISAGERFRFDASHSTIGFSIHQFLGTTRGTFSQFEGTIDLNREHPEKSSVVAKIDVGSIDTKIEKRDNHLRSPEFFNVEKFPAMIFKSRSVKQTGPQSGDIEGDLTMHGVTKPITLHVKLTSTNVNDAKQTHWAVTTEPLKRRDFGLLFSSSAEAISGISQTVSIDMEIEATHE
jgi:polyisoprenoid-binding protein YceI